jgi:hypothetical protein
VIDGRTTCTYTTTNSFLKPNPASNKIDKNADPNECNIQRLIENFNIEKFHDFKAYEGEINNER